jgi:heterotetrameric sarcosine oxidase alpha subunit
VRWSIDVKNFDAADGIAASQPFRCQRGGLIDRSVPVPFKFDRRPMHGYAGDTLAAALLANGVRLVGRSFKYHRPRGVMTAGSEEPNALVELRSGARREPNSKATMIELHAGLEATSQNCWPSPTFDLLSVNGALGRLFVAGFYYKTFMWPSVLWERFYEPLIRRTAGLGRASGLPDPDLYEKATAFCDVLVIGAGAAGLMAALAAARSGARVIVCDEDFRFGGRLLAESDELDGSPAAHSIDQIIAELSAVSDVRLMPRTTVFGVYDGGTYGALERVADHFAEPPLFQPRHRLWRIVAKRTVLAAGAIERPIVFGNNDRPGIMMAGASRTYANRFGVVAGRRAAVFTNNDSGWRTAADLAAAGVEIAAVVDSRASVAPCVVQTATASGARIIIDSRVTGATGGRALRAIEVETRASGRERLAVDTLAVSGGWDPALGLACHLGGRTVWRDDIAAFVPHFPANGMAVVGAANGTFTLHGALTEGAAAGAEAAASVGFAPAAVAIPKADDAPFAIAPMWFTGGAKHKGKAFVDFQNDVTAFDVTLAHREGFRSVEHLKRYTTLGMATDQGKTANVNGLAIMAALTGRTIPETGTTRYRAPYTPVAMGALAGPQRGKHFRPTRLTPSHAWASEQGAVFTETGPWLRAQYFPRQGEHHWLETVNREVSAVRSAAGVCDVSTLGKIDVRGSDAGNFLDRIYVNSFSTLQVGKIRYGLMLREDGFVMDDGTASRLKEDYYLLTATTANAARIMQHLEFCHQVLWPELDIQMVLVTDQWAQYALAGPHSRDVLRAVVDPDHDISNEGLPFMAVAQLTICGGIEARLFRISFSGELGYELAVPARYADALIRCLMEVGAPFGILAYGTEALGVMRIEKGHPAGNELNGQVTANDLGLTRMMSGKKDFIGRTMAGRPALIDPDRPKLVGVRAVDRERRLHAGAHFLALDAPTRPENDQGHMTSVAYSSALGHWIGLGFLKRGPQRIGERIRAYDPVRGNDIALEVCSPAFIDPKGERLRA